MTHLWDTHAVIWALTGDVQLGTRAKTLARAAHGSNAVSCISLWEISLLAHKRRIELAVPLEAFFAEVERRLVVIPISGAIASRAYQLGEFHGDPADRIIAATAIEHGLVVVTMDGKIRDCPLLKSVW